MIGMFRRMGLLSLCMALCLVALPVRARAQVTTFDPINTQRATVAITQMTRTPAGQPVISCVGSGTLISADGLILTNAHIARGSSRCKSDSLVIGLTIRPGEAPVATYYADVLEINIGWDLAVLHITRTLDGRPVDRAALALPFVEIGDSETAKLDDTLEVVGYATNDDKANGAAIIRHGTISNFMEEARVGNRAWIKTNAAIIGGMSGGGAYNTTGKLIGVPTIEPSPGASEACRLVQDTNGDGRVDNQDTCVPAGGYINALRPSRLARGLVRAAQLGISVGGTSDTAPLPKPGGSPAFDRLLIASGVTQAGMPTSVINGAPSGTKSLYLFFDFKNMTDGMVYELHTTVDDVPNPTFSLAPSTWSGGQQGMWYIGSKDQVWPNGTYVFTLLIEGVRAGSKQIVIGGAASPAPLFSDILFGISMQPDGPMVATGNVLPAGDIITAEFVYNNIPAGTAWRQAWYYEGLQITPNANDLWKDGPNGKKQVSARSTPTNPLQAGRYRVELYMGDQLAATSDFVMAGKQDQSVAKVNIFEKLSFASDMTGDQPTNAGLKFANTIPRLYSTFSFNDIAAGTPWTWRWSVDGNPLFEETQPWQAPISGGLFWLRIDGTTHLPDGSYTLELLVGGVSMGKATAKVGLGQLPLNTFTLTSGVQVQGRVLDAETGKAIPGAMFILLKTDVGTKDFRWEMGDVDAYSITDNQGQFQLTKLLPRGASYNFLVSAQGYLPVTTDGFKIDAKTDNPLSLTIELNKD